MKIRAVSLRESAWQTRYRSLKDSGLKIGHQYPLSLWEADMVCAVGDNQGFTAARIADLLWPHLNKHGRHNPEKIAEKRLETLRSKNLVELQIEPPDFYKGGPVRPVGCYYLTEYGYSVYDYWKRQR